MQRQIVCARVSEIAEGVDENILRGYLSRYGDIYSVSMFRAASNGDTSNYAALKTSKETYSLLTKSKIVIRGSKLLFREVPKKIISNDKSGTLTVVRALRIHGSIDSDTLHAHFSQFGEIQKMIYSKGVN